MGDSVGANESLEHKFVNSTSFHGIAQIADRNKSTWLRTAWILAFATCTGVCGWQIYLRFEALHDINTIVSRVYKNELDFPAVTICNFNRYRASQVTEEDLPFIRYALFAEEDYYGDSYDDHSQFDMSSFDYSEFIQNRTFNYTEFTKRTGFVLDNNTLLECKWRGRDCIADNFTHVFTSYGNCWTFNSGKDNRGNDLPILTEDQPGSENGLKLIINIQQDEYTETLSGNIQAGLKVLVHDQADPPLMDSLGSAVPPGYYAFMAIRKEMFMNLEPPWGKCNRSKTLEYYDKYTLSGCFIECRLTLIFEKCECRPIRYPGIAEVCTPYQTATCVKDVLSEFKSGSLGICECPVACNHTEYVTSISYGAVPSQSVADEAYQHFNETLEYQRMNFVVIDIFYEALNFQSFKENKAMTVSTLISNIGGNVGLFLGGSILTFAEIIDYVLLKCCGLCSAEKKRVSKEDVKSTTGENTQQQGLDNPMQLY
ncbi:acid-sensing ion channel 1C-like [Amphiura filiformis]|uniref:acid-sensing ion channel 1C-like n=1 Tax=Amphiura filiformis TaxID=82378 RepID=UPI003B227830